VFFFFGSVVRFGVHDSDGADERGASVRVVRQRHPRPQLAVSRAKLGRGTPTVVGAAAQAERAGGWRDGHVLGWMGAGGSLGAGLVAQAMTAPELGESRSPRTVLPDQAQSIDSAHVPDCGREKAATSAPSRPHRFFGSGADKFCVVAVVVARRARRGRRRRPCSPRTCQPRANDAPGSLASPLPHLPTAMASLPRLNPIRLELGSGGGRRGGALAASGQRLAAWACWVRLARPAEGNWMGGPAEPGDDGGLADCTRPSEGGALVGQRGPEGR
jgi:hypothetical protein